MFCTIGSDGKGDIKDVCVCARAHARVCVCICVRARVVWSVR